MATNELNLTIDEGALGLTRAEGRTVIRFGIFDPKQPSGVGEKGTSSFLLRGEGTGNWKWMFPLAFGKDEQGEGDKDIAKGVEDYWSRGFLASALLADYPYVLLKDGSPWDLSFDVLSNETKAAIVSLMALYEDDNMVVMYVEVSAD